MFKRYRALLAENAELKRKLEETQKASTGHWQQWLRVKGQRDLYSRDNLDLQVRLDEARERAMQFYRLAVANGHEVDFDQPLIEEGNT